MQITADHLLSTCLWGCHFAPESPWHSTENSGFAQIAFGSDHLVHFTLPSMGGRFQTWVEQSNQEGESTTNAHTILYVCCKCSHHLLWSQIQIFASNIIQSRTKGNLIIRKCPEFSYVFWPNSLEVWLIICSKGKKNARELQTAVTVICWWFPSTERLLLLWT